MGECVDVKRDGAIARVVMHRKGINSIAADLMQELGAAFTELGADPDVRVVVLASEYEKYFSVGADLTQLGTIDRSAPDAVAQITASMKRLNEHYNAIERCPKPVIAAINGHAQGGGSELALCCDFRIMVEDGRSKIGQTESSLGIIPGAVGTQRLPRFTGNARALRYIIESTRLSASEAEAVGGGVGHRGAQLCARGPERRRRDRHHVFPGQAGAGIHREVACRFWSDLFVVQMKRQPGPP